VVIDACGAGELPDSADYGDAGANTLAHVAEAVGGLDLPVLTSLGKTPVLLEWDEFPSGGLVPDFVGRLRGELDKRGVPKEAPLYFICRSGNRSRKAAMLATDAGYRRAFNVEFGFEGRLGPDRHRGTTGSWKAEGLPWVQS